MEIFTKNTNIIFLYMWPQDSEERNTYKPIQILNQKANKGINIPTYKVRSSILFIF